MLTPAAAFLQRGGPTRDRQIAAFIMYCTAERYEMFAIVPPDRPGDAVQLIREGRVAVIVAGYDSKAVQQLAADVDDLGRVEVIHPERKVIEPPRHKLGTIGDLILRWWRHGRTVKQIASDIGEETTDVRALLRKYGEHPTD